jgi:hypothetical protein
MTGFINWLFKIAPAVTPYRPAVTENEDDRKLDELIHAASERHQSAAMGVIKPALDGMEDAVHLREDLARVLRRIELAERIENVQRH